VDDQELFYPDANNPNAWCILSLSSSAKADDPVIRVFLKRTSVHQRCLGVYWMPRFRGA
jgi:hypothetical protein